ncbi:hypothetical protein WMF01_35905 [Sorangium sp. So ce1667]
MEGALHQGWPFDGVHSSDMFHGGWQSVGARVPGAPGVLGKNDMPGVPSIPLPGPVPGVPKREGKPGIPKIGGTPGMPVVPVAGCVPAGVTVPVAVPVMLTVGWTLADTATSSVRGPNPSATLSTWAGSSQWYVSGRTITFVIV